MNEQQLQQILTIQQAIAAAATAAVINSLLNPQQAGNLGQAGSLTESPTNSNPLVDLQGQQENLLQQLQQHQQHHHQQQQQQQQQRASAQSPPDVASPQANTADCNNRIQDLLLQLQQQAALGASPMAALNLNLGAQTPTSIGNLNNGANNNLASPIRSPISARMAGQQDLSHNATTSSNILQQSTNQSPSIKKLKKHHHASAASIHQHHHLSGSQQAFNHNRNSEATSKPQNAKNHHSNISSINNRNSATNAHNSSSSSAFLTNNVGLPRKLVRGQDVWLGRGAEQTRQILKCMWCGQSFRTLAEMTQHMKITQHYTNIISQEQITSWRQPETTEANSKHNKPTIQTRNLEDNHDDFSDKFNDDSDREDSISNDDVDLEHQKPKQHRPSNNNRVDHNKSDSTDNNSATESIHGDDSPRANSQTHKDGSPSSKPLTRSRKREREDSPQIKRENELSYGRENSPATSSSSQQPHRQNENNSSSSNLILSDLNQDSETNKEESRKTNGQADTTPDMDRQKSSDGEDEDDSKDEKDLKLKALSGGDDSEEKEKSSQDNVLEDDENPDALNEQQNQDDGDNIDEPSSETNESVTTNTSALAKVATIGQKGETGDPLSALETMVEKSFDPRMRPGVANGGILQRLGIDEEVCPPWQHINYANWYAAAACGHPMAAALLAAGINLQNGIKLSRNIGPKKNED